MKYTNHSVDDLNKVIIDKSQDMLKISNPMIELVFNKTNGLLNTFYPEIFIYKSSNRIIRIGCPDLNWFRFIINREEVSPCDSKILYKSFEQNELKNGGVHLKITLYVIKDDIKLMEIVYHIQLFPDCLITRHRLEVCAVENSVLYLNYNDENLPIWYFPVFTIPSIQNGSVRVINLAEWKRGPKDYSYSPLINEFKINDYYLKDKMVCVDNKGPIMSVFNNQEKEGYILSYEHGSPDEPGEDYYHVRFEHGPDMKNDFVTVYGKNPGIYLDGEMITYESSYSGPWVDFCMYKGGGHDDGLKVLCEFLFKYITEQKSTRLPYVYYNSWAAQRSAQMHGGNIWDPMGEEELLKMIDNVHEMGIDIFVIDAYWYDRFGDWNPHPDLLPNGLKSIYERLCLYGMKLGIWLEPTSASSDSQVVKEHPEWIQKDRYCFSIERNCWDQKGYRMCLSSDYKEYFIKICKRLIDEGVTFIKWDALDLTDCCSSGHWHGDSRHSPGKARVRARCMFINELVYIAEELNKYSQDLIIEFDVTEAERAVGLSFFSQGKYYWLNNGIYQYGYYGSKRVVEGRKMVYEYGNIIPSVLFNHAQYPHNDPGNSNSAVLSSLLGPLGLWGDFELLDSWEISRVRDVLNKYKKVAGTVVSCRPKISGELGGNPEIYEFLDSKSGEGMVVAFSQTPVKFNYKTGIKFNDLTHEMEGALYLTDSEGNLSISFDIGNDVKEQAVFVYRKTEKG